jgi:hypothetical protein
MHSQHHRFAVHNKPQHPFIHTLSDFAYTHPSLPGVSNMQGFADWMTAVIYPQSKPSVANVAALPATGNALGDYRVVIDATGTGKAGGFRWEQREGEASPSWHQISEIDWGADSVLQEYDQRNQDQFVMRYGYDDIDGTGTAITGTLAGQVIYGGRSANSNLTFYPNAGDGASAVSGFVQTAATLRPAVTTNTIDIGTTAAKFRTGYFGTSVLAGTMTVAAGSLTDSSGAISFGADNLSTSGTVAVGTTTLSAAALADTSGSFSFGSLKLSTTGTLAAGVTTVTSLKTGTATLTGGALADTSGAFSFNALNLSTTGTLSAGATTATSFIVGTTTISAAHIADTSGSFSFNALNLSTTGTFAAGATTITGTMAATTTKGGNLQLASNTLSSTNSGGNIVLSPNGGGIVSVTSLMQPSADASFNLGSAFNRYFLLYMSSGITDGTTTMPMATLMSLASINTGVASGNGIFWNGTAWAAADPDTEVFHNSISNLTGVGTDGDAGHTQFVVAAGRASAQTIYGGTGSGANLTIDSTSHATKGSVLSGSTFAPKAAVTGAVDLGIATNNLWRNLYLSGQIFNCRMENTTSGTIPAASASNPGRLVYETDTNDVYVDQGGTWRKISTDNYQKVDSTGWTGSVTSITYSSIPVQNVKNMIWQLQQNATNNKIILCDISFPSTTSVTVSVDIALPAGTYTLVGVG